MRKTILGKDRRGNVPPLSSYFQIRIHPYNGCMGEQTENPAAEEHKTKEKNRTREILGFILRLARLAIFGSAKIFKGLTTLPGGFFPSLNMIPIALIAAGGPHGEGIL